MECKTRDRVLRLVARVLFMAILDGIVLHGYADSLPEYKHRHGTPPCCGRINALHKPW